MRVEASPGSRCMWIPNRTATRGVAGRFWVLHDGWRLPPGTRVDCRDRRPHRGGGGVSAIPSDVATLRRQTGGGSPLRARPRPRKYFLRPPSTSRPGRRCQCVCAPRTPARLEYTREPRVTHQLRSSKALQIGHSGAASTSVQDRPREAQPARVEPIWAVGRGGKPRVASTRTPFRSGQRPPRARPCLVDLGLHRRI
jgi:hypothetical protein